MNFDVTKMHGTSIKKETVSFTSCNEGYSENKLMAYRFLATKPDSDFARGFIV